jgi:hypothetical protein
MPACFSEQGGSQRRQELFIEEFLRRLREAPPGTRVYMQCGDVFKTADAHSLAERRIARRAAVVRDGGGDEGEEPRQ